MKSLWIISVLFIVMTSWGQESVSYKSLKEVNRITYNRYSIIKEYEYNGEPFTGNAYNEATCANVYYKFKDGKLHGKMESFFKSGEKKGYIIYKKGLVVENMLWRKDGTKKSYTKNKDGYRKAQKSWFSNGNLNLVEKYKHNGDLRTYKRYNSEGFLLEKGKKLRIQGQNSDRLVNIGKWMYYNEQGQLNKIEHYNESGNLLSEELIIE